LKLREHGFIRNNVCGGIFGNTKNVLGILFEKQKITRVIPWLRRLFSGSHRGRPFSVPRHSILDMK
jgi:hypothetical protein